MSRLHLLILWALAITAGIIYFQRKDVEQDIDTKTKLEIGSDLIAGETVETIDGFQISDGEDTVTVKKVDGQWSVVEKDNFPANLTTVSRAMRALRDARVAQGVVASQEYYNRFDLDPQAKDDDLRPESITFLKGDEEGPVLYLGKTRTATGGSTGRAGRFVRLSNDDSGVYVTSESFSFLNYDPSNWIEKFLTPLEEKALEIEVTAPNDEAFKSWKVSRQTVLDDFLLTDLGEKEETRTNETALLKNSFVRASFTELVDSEEYQKRADKKGIRTVKATDSGGSTFLITITPEKKDEKPADKKDDAPVPAIDYLVSIEVLNGPTKPEPPAEDATVQEKAVFQERVANLEELSASVNRMRRIYQGRYFLVNQASVDPFLKNRGELVKSKQEKKDPVSVTTDPIEVSGSGARQKPALPGTNPKAPPASIARPDNNKPRKPRVEAVTPPIRVPPLPEKSEAKKPDEAVQPPEKPKPSE